MSGQSQVIFNGVLGAVFAPTQPIVMIGERVTMDFDVTVTANDTKIDWYLEFSEDLSDLLNNPWRREIAEEDVGNGITWMPKVIRTLTEEGNQNGLDIGVHHVSAQMLRSHKFARMQLRASSGSASVRVVAPFGYRAVVPS